MAAFLHLTLPFVCVYVHVLWGASVLTCACALGDQRSVPILITLSSFLRRGLTDLAGPAGQRAPGHSCFCLKIPSSRTEHTCLCCAVYWGRTGLRLLRLHSRHCAYRASPSALCLGVVCCCPLSMGFILLCFLQEGCAYGDICLLDGLRDCLWPVHFFIPSSCPGSH